MFDFLFDTTHSFKAYTYLHWWPLIFFVFVLGSVIIFARQKLSHKQRIVFGTSLATIPALCVILRMILTAIDGTFSIQEGLPFHICRTIALVFPFVIYHQSRKWFGILYFFTIVGTSQALLTPDLPLSVPHHSYWTYWLLHCTLISLPIYCIVNFDWKVTKRDFWNAILAGNVYLLVTGIINYLIGSNYFYKSHNPQSPTLLDFLGPWPWYLLAVEGLAVIFFLLAGLPFWVGRKD
jgi:hypothetical integral membrane protein (TIGR02206 family)